ncbi:MAG TPA: GyrI-like domain-containing protein [Alphaproteobacteria bacterium]|nr:GyrI-like domain-containing protein [Alphaproteobacteria bacterium]
MPQIDHRQQLPHLYAPEVEDPHLVEVPAMNFIMIDGEGDPAHARSFAQGLETLRYLAFALKFNLVEVRPDQAFAVMPFEALIWQLGGPAAQPGEAAGWRWTALVMQPEAVTLEHFQATAAEVIDSSMAKMVAQVRFASFTEGRCAQVLHQGSLDDGGRSVGRLQEFIAAQDLEPAGLHHEIYLNDPLRTRADRRRTILRQPVRWRSAPPAKSL